MPLLEIKADLRGAVAALDRLTDAVTALRVALVPPPPEPPAPPKEGQVSYFTDEQSWEASMAEWKQAFEAMPATQQSRAIRRLLEIGE